MGAKTGISWTGSTWNWLRGCSRCSTGCLHCYAETIAGRFSDEGQAYHGFAERRLKVISDDDQRLEGRWTGKVEVVPEHLFDPVSWRAARRIFVNSTSDTFHERVASGAIALAYLIMAACRRHTFQVLTKRASLRHAWFVWVDKLARERGKPVLEVLIDEAIAFVRQLGSGFAWVWDGLHKVIDAARRAMIDDKNNGRTLWPLPNVWEGTSVENQKYADERIPELLATPATVRFLSCEPLIDRVDLGLPNAYLVGSTARKVFRDHGGVDEAGIPTHLKPGPALHWVIAGCESGHGARPANVEWFRLLRDQCARAGVAFFLKQAVSPWPELHMDPTYWMKSTPRRDLVEGPASKRKGGGVVELPYLDGVQHAAFPA